MIHCINWWAQIILITSIAWLFMNLIFMSELTRNKLHLKNSFAKIREIFKTNILLAITSAEYDTL